MFAQTESSARYNPAVIQRGLGKTPATDLHDLFAKQPVEQIDSGASIVWEGDPAGHVFEVVEGVLRLFRMIGDGRRAITGFLYPGDIMGIALRKHYLYSAEAVTPSRVRRISRVKFEQEATHSPALRPQMIEKMCEEMASAQQQMVLLARKTAEERVCSFLLITARAMTGNGRFSKLIDLPMSRLDIADHLGLTIETVSRTISRLARNGVVGTQGRHAIVINSTARLAQLTGDDDDGAAWTDRSCRPCQAVWPH